VKRSRGAPPLVTLLTDFGTADGYVGAMKGVIASLAPSARVVDVTHDIPAGDVRGGALALETAAPYFPPGTIHVAVVDPGVGTARRGVAVEAGGQLFVGPDNGVLALARAAGDRVLALAARKERERRVFVLDRARYHLEAVSPTFHGRDVFAPIAARLATGIRPSTLGTETDDLCELVLPRPSELRGGLAGEVIHADRFGNLITNIIAEDLARLGGGARRTGLRIHVGRRRLAGGLARTYGDAGRHALLALVGSSGRLEIARRDGSAAALLGYRPGRKLAVRCVSADRG
jgi:S-adenosylmethionine hydrolase